MPDKPFSGATRSISILILILLILISCDNAIQEPPLGSLVVSADEAITRTITPDLQSLLISSYKVFGVGPDAESFEKEAQTLPIQVPNLREGDWLVSVEAYNNNNQKIAEKTRTVRITAGETTSETFILSWISGFGSLQVRISWPSSIAEVASIKAALSQNGDVFEETNIDTTLATQVSNRFMLEHNLAVLPTGSYDYTLTFLDESDQMIGLLYMDQVNIHDGMISVGDCEIPDGFLPIGKPYTDTPSGQIPYGTPISLLSSTESVSIYYTIDGTEPTLESNLYTTPVILSRSATIKAIAVDSSGFSSDVESFPFALKLQDLGFSSEPGIFHEPVNIAIQSTDSEPIIYYSLDGEDPRVQQNVYTGPLYLFESCTVSAVAVLAGVESSNVLVGQFQFHTQPPTVTLEDAGPYPSPFTVQLTSATEGATILYTLDGSDSYPNGTVYPESGITLTETTTIRAIAVKGDSLPSIEKSWKFIVFPVTEKPTSAHNSAVYTEPQEVELVGAGILFTIDGSDPSVFGEPYTEPILVSENTRIRAVSMKDNHLPSAELDITIKIQAAVPTASPQPGTHTGNQIVFLASTTEGSIIRYTTDGITPTGNSMVFDPAEPIILRENAVIKAFTEKENMEPSAVVSMDYSILGGTAGVDVIPPTAIHIDFLPSPELSESSITAFSEGMILAMSPNLSPDATFRWYFDGVAARGNDGNLVGERQVLMFGDSGEAITLQPGSHAIVAKVDKDGMTYSRQLIINVSSTMRQYTVKFDSGEGSMNPAEIFRKVVTTKVYGTLPVPTLPNHEFLGWNTEPGGSGGYVTEDTMVDVSSDITLYAYYEPVTVRVLFEAQEGTHLQESYKDLEYGMLYGNLPAVERTGYSFGGWYTEPEGKGQRIDTASPLVSLDEHTLYAKWIAPVTVTFVVSDGGTLSFTQKSVLVGQKYGELPEGTKEGHALSGWWLSSNHQGTQISSNSLVETASNHALYAKWSPFFYAVKFNPEGGSVSTGMTTVTYGTKYGNLPVPINDGHTFDGWWTTPSSGGTRITSDTLFLTANMQELYARWTPNKYKISFNAGEHDTLSMTEKLVTYGNTYGTLPTATRAGYLFQGWYSDEALTRQVNASDQMVVNNEHVLYAKWNSLFKSERLSYEGQAYFVGREVLQPGQTVYHVQTQDGHAISDTTDAYKTLVRAKTIVDDSHFEYNVFVEQTEAEILDMKDDMEMAVNWSNVAFGVTYARNFFVRVLGDLVFIGPNPAKLTASALNGFIDDFLANLQNPREFLRNWALGQLKAAMDSCDDFVNVSQSIRYWREHPNTLIASEDIVQAQWDYVFITSTKAPMKNFIFELQHESLLEQFESIFNQMKNRLISEVESKLLEALNASTLGDMKEAYELISNAVAHSYGIYYNTIDEFTACVNTINYNRVYFSPPVGNWLPVDKKAKISVDFNIGYGDNPVIATTIFEEGDTYRYSPVSNPPEPRAGYIFEGWYTYPDGQGPQINADTVLSRMVDHTLYAYWGSNAVDVSFDIGFGEPYVIDVFTVTKGNPYGSLPKIYASDRPGYEFIGWYTGRDGTGDLITSDTTLTIVGNHTLYAYWEITPPITRTELDTMIANGEDVTQVNTSQITDMSRLFQENQTFNQDISGWDVSNVDSMSFMFAGAGSFNQDISSWDVSHVEDMSCMFLRAGAFNHPLSDWDVSQVRNMAWMFREATSFNQDISSWDVSHVQNMMGMFYIAPIFNQDISSWDVSNVTNISQMFCAATSFNQDLSAWNVSRVEFMNGLFDGASSFNQDIGNWDTSNVTRMDSMFCDAASFNQDLSKWDVAKVTDMGSMFCRANTFNQDLSNWAVHNVVNYSGFTTSGSAMAENNYPNFGQEVSYTVRDIGPAGGYVFYDDEIGYDLNGNGTIDDDEKNLLGEGKRYLEAAPAGWSVWSEDRYYVFGFYRTSVSGPNQKVDTGTEIGTGKANTQKLVNAMGSGAYSSISGSETTAQYAARLCTNYRGGGNADWFLPSKDELNLMYENLKRNNLGGFENLNYWSSSEIEWGGQHYGWFQNFNDGGQNDIYRYVELRVRPVRAF